MHRITTLFSTASCKSLLPLISLLALNSTGCDTQSPPDEAGARIRLEVAPLSLPMVDNARYTIAVTNGLGQPVWSATIEANGFGDGQGSITYIGPCDASEPSHTVTLTLDQLWDVERELFSPADYKNPGPIVRTNVMCSANADTLVEFNLTIMRSARQGFFDVAVNFDDIFCSAKLDCTNSLLHYVGDDARTGRGPTAIVGFACTSGSDESGATPTLLYLSDLTLACVDPNPNDGDDLPAITQDISLANLADGQQGPASPMLYNLAAYLGQEQLPGLNKCYWNHALGLDLAAIGARECTLSATGTASGSAIAGGVVADNVVWPVITWSVKVKNADGTLCRNHGLDDDDSDVTTSYLTPGTDLRDAFKARFECGNPPAVEPGFACSGPTGSVFSAARTATGGAGVQVVANGLTSATFALPEGAKLVERCCLDACCDVQPAAPIGGSP